MLTKEEREILQAFTEQLRRAHARDWLQIDAPVHISTVTAVLPELVPVRD